MAVITVLDTKNEKLNKVKAFSTGQDVKVLSKHDLKVKRTGNYLYVDTPNEGIKKVVNGEGGYLAFLDYGKTYKANKKTGELELKPNKTTRHVKTEREAKKLRRQAEEIRNKGVSAKQEIRKVLFGQALKDFYESPVWAKFTQSQKDTYGNHYRHMEEYFKNLEPKDITVTEIEKYYDFQLKHGNRLPVKKGQDDSVAERGGISVNTLYKHKTAMKKLWQYFIDSGKYGINVNLASIAKIPKVEIQLGDTTIEVAMIEHHATSLTLEEINFTLNDAVQNEFDRSVLVMIALAVIGSLRRGETVGLELRKFMHNELMDISPEHMKYSGYDKEYYEQHDELMLIDNSVVQLGGKYIAKLPKRNKIRIAMIPECLKRIVAYAMEQRQQVYDITGKEIDGREPVYLPLTNAVRGTSFNCRKLDNRWNEYQKRRNKRMEEMGLKPIKEISYHELRHTHDMLLRGNAEVWNIAYNMGHKLPAELSNTTTEIYWNDGRPVRDDIIKYFDDNIKIDWDKALHIAIDDNECQVKINNSGHLSVSRELLQKYNTKLFKDEEYEQLFLGEAVD